MASDNSLLTGCHQVLITPAWKCWRPDNQRMFETEKGPLHPGYFSTRGVKAFAENLAFLACSTHPLKYDDMRFPVSEIEDMTRSKKPKSRT